MRSDASTRSGYADAIVAATLDALLARLKSRRPPWLAGLSGLQGSGKSTFARQLAAAANARGIGCVVLSLDDFYLGRRARRQLARRVHPLFATRGVPGTHDLALLTRTLDALRRASARSPALLPRFDKGRDTRVAPSRWRRVHVPPRLILLEGWCVGVPAQDEATLRRPLNALERDEDGERRWRGRVNEELAHGYARLWRRFDALVLLQAPGFDVVTRWRDEQERALRRRGAPQAMDRAALARFLMHYERLSRVALRELPARADLRLRLDRERRVVEASWMRIDVDERGADVSA
ncbi:kinase [Dokdonella ginsengisoli]|uniref:Kinase n=1 Tax=Dokdonella ginsengisoli TaxID=363846 RepID=A0ABV9QQS2_9GAMM